MTTPQETIARREAVLRAMAMFWHNDPDSPAFAAGARKMYEAATDAVIAAHDDALTAADFVVVPVEPTEEMLAAAVRELDDPHDEGHTLVSNPATARAVAIAVHRAMLRAAASGEGKP